MKKLPRFKSRVTALGSSSAASAQQRHRVTTGGCSRTNKKPARVLEANRVCAKKQKQELPAGPVVKNPPANAGDTGSVLVQEGPHAAGRLSPRTTVLRPRAWSPCSAAGAASAPRSPVLQLERSPHTART